MTDASSPPNSGLRRFLPELRSRWWTLLLAGSLMANLLIGGLILGQRLGHGPGERMAGATATQLIPRKFFQDLPRERRHELFGNIRNSMRDLRGLRDGSAAVVLQLASDLESEPYDPLKVRQTVQSYSTGTGSLASRSGAVVMDVLDRLTPDERKALAVAIRERATSRKQRTD